MTGYFCKACEAPATVDADGVHRTCGCNTTVIAGMTARAVGHGAVHVEPTLTQKILNALHQIGLYTMRPNQ